MMSCPEPDRPRTLRPSSAPAAAEAELRALDSSLELIQALIPLGLEAVSELL